MALDRTKLGAPFDGVSAGGLASSVLPIGQSYRRVLIPYSGTTFDASDIDELRIMANGLAILRYSGDDLNTISQFDGLPDSDTANVISINFERVGLLTKTARQLTTLGTGMPQETDPDKPFFNPVPITTLTVEVDISSGAVDPVLGRPTLVQAEPQVTGLILQTRTYSYNPSGSGVYDIASIPKGDLFNRVWFIGSNIIDVQIELDSYLAFERTAEINNIIQSEGDGIRTPQPNVFCFDPTETGKGAQNLITVDRRGVPINDLRFKLNMSGAAQVKVIVEVIRTL